MKRFFNSLFSKKQDIGKQGRWKEFNKHGVLISVGNFLNGQKHGHWMEYYDSGELLLEENYINGVMQGRFVTYHRNGRIMSEGNFENGRREGYFKVYTETGIHFKSLLFVNDALLEEAEVIA